MQHISKTTDKIANQHISMNSQTPDQLSHGKTKRLFALLQANYGSRWVDQTGTGNALKLSMQVWGEMLAGLTDGEIKHGLGNLPEDYTPSPTKFKNLCKAKNHGLSHNTAAYRTFRKELPPPRNTSLARKEIEKAKRILKGERNIERVTA